MLGQGFPPNVQNWVNFLSPIYGNHVCANSPVRFLIQTLNFIRRKARTIPMPSGHKSAPNKQAGKENCQNCTTENATNVAFIWAMPVVIISSLLSLSSLASFLRALSVDY